NPVYDAIGSICIGVILLVISVFIASRVRSLLVGRSADPDIRDAIDEIISEHGEIVHVYNIITMQFGPDTMLAAKIRMRDGMDIGAAVASINALEQALKQRIDKLKWCFIEPDVRD
ncbi:MAG: cation efflux family transporter, partial [Gammaproteobacteria bacterium]|nr:cation efflux family transporter [Gammaproteobacteria bacterium]